MPFDTEGESSEISPSAGRSTASGGTVSLSEMFDVLSHHHNRYVLQQLLREDASIAVEELTARIAAMETPTPVTESGQSEL
jgi:hypothetical protein